MSEQELPQETTAAAEPVAETSAPAAVEVAPVAAPVETATQAVIAEAPAAEAPAAAPAKEGEAPKPRGERPPRPPRPERAPRPEKQQGAPAGPAPNREGGKGEPRGERGERGPRPEHRGPRPGGPGGPGGGGKPFLGRMEGFVDFDVEKLIGDSLYLDNAAHAVVARMRDMDSGTKSQLRRLYSSVRRATRAPEADRQHQFVMLRARIAYTIARHGLRSLDPLERLLLQVTRKNDARGYERFRDLFEAIVAYNE